VHKRRNVLGHLPQSERGRVKRALDEAWNSDDPKRAKRLLENLARSLESQHPGAAASLREGLDDTLTLLRLGVRGTLFQSIRSTNAIESLNDKIATYTRRVKRWSGGKMMLRWVGAAILDAREGMRGVRGLKDMTILCNALERHEKTLHSGSEAA
jgi:transposase-like protein